VTKKEGGKERGKESERKGMSNRVEDIALSKSHSMLHLVLGKPMILLCLVSNCAHFQTTLWGGTKGGGGKKGRRGTKELLNKPGGVPI